MTRTVLITGGAGFIGSHLADAYRARGFRVVLVDNMVHGQSTFLNSQDTFYQVDICSPEIKTIFKKEQPDIVNHHAAQIDLLKSISDPLADIQVNVLGTVNLLQAAVQNHVKAFVFASSGGAIYSPQKTFPADETHPLYPVSPYGVAKLSAEKYIYFYHKHYGLNAVNLRYANVYGPRQNARGEAGVVAIFCDRMLKGQALVVYGDGLQTRDYVYVDDVVDANLRVSDPALTGYQEYNVATGIESTVLDLVQGLTQQVSGKIETIHQAARKGEQARSVLDASKISRALKWQAKVGLTEGLERTFRYFQK